MRRQAPLRGLLHVAVSLTLYLRGQSADALDYSVDSDLGNHQSHFQENKPRGGDKSSYIAKGPSTLLTARETISRERCSKTSITATSSNSKATNNSAAVSRPTIVARQLGYATVVSINKDGGPTT
jgi:hypothetical protein